jgi:pantothenate kinase-related protein Tda10
MTMRYGDRPQWTLEEEEKLIAAMEGGMSKGEFAETNNLSPSKVAGKVWRLRQKGRLSMPSHVRKKHG